MCLVTFWKCYFPPSPTQNPPPHNRKTTKTPPPTPPQQQQKNQRSKRESKKSKSHRNVDRFVGRSKSHKKSKSHREREIGSWVHGWVAGEVEGSWVEGSRSKIDSWVRRSAKSKAWSGLWVRRWSRRHDLGSLSLSLSLFACESRNGLKWKFWLKPIFGSKPLKHTVNWKYFPENLFSMRSQIPAFTEKHFRTWFEAKTNIAWNWLKFPTIEKPSSSIEFFFFNKKVNKQSTHFYGL